MNFLINLYLGSDKAEQFGKEFVEFLTKFDIDAKSTLLDNNNTVIVAKPLVKAADDVKVEESELSPEEAENTPALNEDDLCPMCGEKECDCPERDHKCEKCKDEHPCEKCSDEVKEAVLVDFGPCKVLTLSTQTAVNTKVDLTQESTTLYVSAVDYEYDCEQVRFKFNMHEHVLPTFKGQRAILNESSMNSDSAVRLVLEFSGKTYPSVVEVSAGSEDVLVIGTDLYEILQKDKSLDVSSKQH